MFGQKLKEVMQELNLNQVQLAGLIGKSRGSVSQYLSGTQTPPKEKQKEIAVSLGLAPDYFVQENSVAELLSRKKEVIPRLPVKTAAKLMQMNHLTVQKGLQQGVFPWGYGIHTSENRWVYFINARRFAEIEGIEV